MHLIIHHVSKNRITHSTNTVKINAINVSDKKTVALFIRKRAHRQTDEKSCYTQLLSSSISATYFFFYTRITKQLVQPSALIELHHNYILERIMGLCSHMPVKNDHTHSTQLLNTVSENHVLQKLITLSHFHISAINPDPLALPTKACKSIIL